MKIKPICAVYEAPTRAHGTCHRHQKKNLALCCCAVKHRNAPVRDYGVTLVHSPRQAGWLLTGNPGATRHLGVEAWKMFCMLQQSVWSQSGKRHRWFFTLQRSSVSKETVLPLSCRGVIFLSSIFLMSLLNCALLSWQSSLITWLSFILFMLVNCDFLFFRISCVQQKIVNMFIYIPYAWWLNIAQVFSFAHAGIESPCVISCFDERLEIKRFASCLTLHCHWLNI